MLINTLLLFAVPVGYWIAALFLVIAIILFIISIFMKDSGQYYNEGDYERDQYEREQYNKKRYAQEAVRKNARNSNNINTAFDESEFGSYDDDYDSYDETYDNDENENHYDRYNPSDAEQTYSKETEELKGLIADVTDNMGETRAFTPVRDDNDDKHTRILSQDKDNSWNNRRKATPAFDEEFSEELDAEDDDDTDYNQGMSFADEVRMLIEEEEKKKHKENET